MNPLILKYISTKSITLYFAALFVVNVLFFQHAMKWYWFIFGAVSVVGFFKYAPILYRKFERYSPKLFEKTVFRTALIIRVAYVIFSYLFYVGMTGVPFEFHAADAHFYNHMGEYGASLIGQGEFNLWAKFEPYANLSFSDGGYPIYLSIIYFFTFNSIFIARIIKALLGAWICVLIYRLASRNFGESVARLAAIFCIVMPNLIYYCGLHVKEAEMVFLTVLFIERADLMLRQPKVDFRLLLTTVILGLSLFTFRAVLGAVAFLAIFTALVLSSKKIASLGKKFILGFFVILLLGVSIGNRISEEVNELLESSSTNQSNSLEFRAERKGGNSFAKYASSAVFAPLIFTIPFPTIVEVPNQEQQRMIHGGNFAKNITSFFTLLALLTLLFSGEWRKHVLPVSFMCGYLLVIALSAFAQSERFHLPALPFALMFAAYGISKFRKKHQFWFQAWLILMFVAAFAWSWFKLTGRGL